MNAGRGCQLRLGDATEGHTVALALGKETKVFRNSGPYGRRRATARSFRQP